MGKLHPKVWSQTAINSLPAFLKIKVAQKLITGHIRQTVTPALVSVTNRGRSLPGVTNWKAIFGARRSMKKNPMIKQMGNMRGISLKARRKL